MTDDEVFIRAVVDSPGGDLPRRVYADWLDDRADPRGEYLRAELEWARPWQTGTPPGWPVRQPGRGASGRRDEFTGAAEGLDPEWVARVSRPPAGVCCDHLRFSARGPRLAADEVRAAEQRLGVTLPATLAAFVRNYNGGKPAGQRLVYRRRVGEDATPGSAGSDSFDLDDFAGLSDQPRPGREFVTIGELIDELRFVERELGGFGVDDLTSWFVPFGRGVESSSWVLTTAYPLHAGKAFRLELFGERPVPELLAASIPQLLARLVAEGV